MRRLILATIVAMLAAAAVVLATSASPRAARSMAARMYYVSPTGSDSNNGTSANTPWKTIAMVNATTLTAGQSVAFQGGQTFSGEIAPNGSGVAGDPTTYTSYGTGKAIISGHPATYPTGVSYVTYTNLIMDGGSAGDCVADFTGAAATNITFDNVEMRNCFDGINQQRASDANWTIQNSYIHNTSDSGIIVGGPSHTVNGGGFVIQNNQIENTGTQSSITAGYNSHGIYNDSPGIQIVDNDIGNFQTSAISTRVRNATIQGNTIHDGTRSCCSSAIGYYNYDATETAGGGTTVVRYNRIWNVPYGMLIDGGNFGGGPAAGPENWRIYNNTFSGSAAASGYGIDYRSGSTGTALTIKNNIFTGSFSIGALHLGRTPSTYAENFNDWNSTGGALNGDTGAQDITAAPNLSAAPAFAPNPGSPVIGAGTATVAGATFTNACSGQVLDYCGSAPDLGAVEFSSTPTRHRRSSIGS